MGKLYTLDDKLLIGTPEIRIKDKIYPVDDRVKTVKKFMELKKQADNSDRDDIESIKAVFKLAFGEAAANEIEEMNLPFAAYSRLFEITISAMVGEDQEERFPKPDTAE